MRTSTACVPPAAVLLAALCGNAIAQPMSLPIATNGTALAPSLMFDLVPDNPTLGLTVASICPTLNVPPGVSVVLTLYSRTDTYVGHETSSTGWSIVHSRGVVSAGPTQPTCLPLLSFPIIFLPAGSARRGFVILADSPGAQLSFAAAPPAATTYSDGTLRMHTGPATGSPPWSSILAPGAAMVGLVSYEPFTTCMVYANCDGSTIPPALNVNDFVCFNELFAAGSTWANCDGSTTVPRLNVNDFICFLNAFARGCTAP